MKPSHLTQGLSYDLIGPDFRVRAGHDDPASITFLKSTDPEQPLAKVSKQEEVGGPFFKKEVGHPRLFKVLSVPISDGLPDIYKVLDTVRGSPDFAIMRGAFLEGEDVTVRRAKRMHGDRRTIVDAPRLWLMVDIDKSTAVEARDGWMKDPEPVVRSAIREHLPQEFQDAGVVVQFSSSMGARGCPVSCHLFFWLSRPVWSIEAAHWLASWPVDQRAFLPSQELYCADPIMIRSDGTVSSDPLGGARVHLFDGPQVNVAYRIEASNFSRPLRSTLGRGAPSRGLDWPEHRHTPWRECARLTGSAAGDEQKGYHDWMLKRLIPNYCLQTRPRHDKEELRAALIDVGYDPKHPDEPGLFEHRVRGQHFDDCWRGHPAVIEADRIAQRFRRTPCNRAPKKTDYQTQIKDQLAKWMEWPR